MYFYISFKVQNRVIILLSEAIYLFSFYLFSKFTIMYLSSISAIRRISQKLLLSCQLFLRLFLWIPISIISPFSSLSHYHLYLLTFIRLHVSNFFLFTSFIMFVDYYYYYLSQLFHIFSLEKLYFLFIFFIFSFRFIYLYP